MLWYPIIKAPNIKSVLPSVDKTRNSTGLKMCTHIVLALVSDQKIFSQPSQYWNFPYQGFYPPQLKLPAAQVLKFAYSFSTDGWPEGDFIALPVL